jgi:hypothetical protein
VPRHPARYAAAAIAVITCLALGLSAVPAAPAGAAVHPPAPVYHWFAHPGKPTNHPIGYPENYTGTRTLYAICLSHAPNECLATSTKAIGDTIGIWVGDAGVWLTLIWLIVTNKQGRETPQDKGDTSGKGGKHAKGKHFNQCLDGRQTGSTRAVFTTNCFGNNLSSWIPVATNPPATQYHIYNYESALKAGHDANLLATTRATNGADVYNAKNHSGLWDTWSYYPEGTCTGC